MFSFEDGVRLTKARGEAMQAAADSEKSGQFRHVNFMQLIALLSLHTTHMGQHVAVQTHCVLARFTDFTR